MQGTAVIEDHRSREDRRSPGWRTVFYGFIRSRRRGSRRQHDGEAVFSDWHHPWLFFLAIFTMLFSSLDAFLTLQLLERGATEANPFMASLMLQGTTLFAAMKMALTGIGVLTLVYLSRAMFMNRVRTGIMLTVSFTLYACLICYEIVHFLSLT